MRSRYAVEKGDDGLKYRILDLDVAPPPVLHEHWEQPKRKQRGKPRAKSATVLKVDAPEASPRYGALLEGLAYPPLPAVPHRLVGEERPSVQRYGPTERAVTLWGHEIACLLHHWGWHGEGSPTPTVTHDV